MTNSVRKNRVRPKYKHGCGGSCGRKFAGYCPQRVALRPKVADVKSRAGRRPFPLPDTLVVLLEAHKKSQDQDRVNAGTSWVDEGWVFATEAGDAINPNTDYHDWKQLLKVAGVRDARLHDARHTAATNLLLVGVLDRVTQGLMGWSDPTMAQRYQHLTQPVQAEVAKRLEALLWNAPETPLKT